MLSPQQMQQQRQKQMEEYVQTVVGALEKDPTSLNAVEKRFGTKYVQSLQRVRAIEADLTQLREQIRQGEARVRSLELQHQSETGKTSAYVESLVALKFDEEPEPIKAPEPAAPGEDPPPKGDNGTSRRVAAPAQA